MKYTKMVPFLVHPVHQPRLQCFIIYNVYPPLV